MKMNGNNSEADGGLNGILDAALEIAQERRENLARLRTALENGNDPEALRLAKELCGLDNEKESRRNPSRLN